MDKKLSTIYPQVIHNSTELSTMAKKVATHFRVAVYVDKSVIFTLSFEILTLVLLVLHLRAYTQSIPNKVRF